MADILAVPLKKTSEVDLIKPLKNVIALRFSTADNPEDFGEAIVELNKLRNNANIRALDKQESSLEILARYCDQLGALEGKIPSQDLQVAFKWKDAFDKGSLFSGKMSLTISSLSYERMCSLFNLAAFQSQVASIQSHDNDVALKLATKLLQSAASIFSYLKTSVMGALQQEPTPDMNPDTLAALSALMLAEAQEIFVIKAINDKMKDGIVAKLASQCEEFYSDALKLMQSSRTVWDRDWVPKVNAKQDSYQGISQFFQSRVCSTKKLVGEEIARLQLAINVLKAAQQKVSDPTHHQDYINRAQRFLTDAQKDNDFIYHERVPDPKNLEPIGKAALAKVSPMPSHLSSNFNDLFDTLTPIVIHQAMGAWEVRKIEIINVEVGKLREANQFLNGVLASLNLPAALEESTGELLPQSLKDKARSVREVGGITLLNNLIAEFPSLLQRNKEILDEAERLLSEERNSDEQLKTQFKERWNRTPSTKLTEAFVTNISKYRTLLENAVSADATVQSKLDLHRRGIEMLSRSEQELEAAIPSATQSASDNSHSPSAAQLRILMGQVAELKSDREVLECELKSATVDMKEQFLSALAHDGNVNEPAMSVEKLGEVYGPIQKRIRESIELQTSLLSEIQHYNENFVKEKAGGTEPSAREELMKELAIAHDIHMEVQNNLQEGSKFYNDLTQMLLSFQSKISDFCFARKAEKDELLKDLTSSYASSGPPSSAPNLPSHHNLPGNTREAPARPPPPNFNTQAAPVMGSAPPMGSAPGAPPAAAPQASNSYMPYPINPVYAPYAMPQPYFPNPSQPMQNPAAPPSYNYANQPGSYPPAGAPQGYPGYQYPYYNPNPNPGYPGYTPPRPPQW